MKPEAGLRRLSPLLLAVLLLVGWEVLVRLLHVESYLLPAPSRIAVAFWELRAVLPGHIAVTALEALLGLILGATAGAITAAILWAFPLLRRSVFPLLVVSQTIPMATLAPLLVLWFGLGLLPKVLVVALAAFFPVTVATIAGLASAEVEYLQLLRSMGAGTRLQARLVLIPSAAAAFVSGLRIAATYAVSSAVVAEWVGASSGLGLLATRAQSSFRIDRVFVAITIVAALSLLLHLLISFTARIALPWQTVDGNSAISKGVS